MHHYLLLPIASLVALAVLPARVSAQSFSDLETALRDHPSLAVYSHQAEASHEMAIAATGLPDPVISIGVNNLPISDPGFDRFLPTNKTIGIRQQIPNGAGRKASSKQAEAQAEKSIAARNAQFDMLRAELVSLLADKQRIQIQKALAEERMKKHDSLLELYETEIEAGRPVAFQLARIDADKTGVSGLMIDLASEEAQINAQLINLVGLVPDTPPPDLPSVEWQGNPESFHAVRIAASDIDVADNGVSKAKAAWAPEFGVQVNYQQREAGNGDFGSTFAGDDWVSGMVTVSVPLWSGRNQKPKLRAAKASRAAAQSQYTATARHARAQYDTFKAMRDAAISNRANLEEKAGHVRAQIDAQLSLFESGRGTYAPIIDGELVLLTLRSEIAAQSARALAATARMNATLVTP